MIGFDTSVFPTLNFRSREEFWGLVDRLRAFFDRYCKGHPAIEEKAVMLKTAFDRLDPFIQSYTAKVCPYCGTVCCAMRHGVPEFADIVGFLAMGLDVPLYDLSRDMGGACQFMGKAGCSLRRIERPYRCTWYFCDPLLKQIEIGPVSHYRRFIRDVEGLAAARGGLMAVFYGIWSEKAGDRP
ncbi:MAG: hypothetical protein ACP5SG_06285 [Dissulfurimicrobium sp.]|uniref:hypothetical protein n=1 Tax=Dissulfurimicrobium sp. TaxID=2022436 RepID=UPI003D13988A